MSREQSLKCIVPRNGGSITRVPAEEAQRLVELEKSHRYASKIEWKRQKRSTKEGADALEVSSHE